jgi:hypothetical protein
MTLQDPLTELEAAELLASDLNDEQRLRIRRLLFERDSRRKTLVFQAREVGTFYVPGFDGVIRVEPSTAKITVVGG